MVVNKKNGNSVYYCDLSETKKKTNAMTALDSARSSDTLRANNANVKNDFVNTKSVISTCERLARLLSSFMIMCVALIKQLLIVIN